MSDPRPGLQLGRVAAGGAVVESHAARLQVRLGDEGLGVFFTVDAQTAVLAQHIRAALVAAQNGLGLVHVQRVQGPAGLQIDGRAVLHLNEAEGGVLHGEFLGIPRAPSVGGILMIRQLAEGGTRHHGRLVVVHFPQGQIQRVGADIDQGTAALIFRIQKHAPGGHGPAANGLGAGVVNVAQFAVFTELFQIHAVLTETALIADGQLFAGALGRVQHLLGLGGIDGHGLFAHDMLARLQRVHRDERMLLVGGQHMHHVDVLLLQQLLIVGINPGVRGAIFFGGLFRPLLHHIAESDHFNRIDLFQRGHMLAVGDAAAADDADMQFTIHRRILHCMY